jgi:hypothetical protein
MVTLVVRLNPVGALGAEINNFPAHHHRVRDGNDVILTGEDLGRQHANLADLSLIVGEADPVAFAQRPGVDQHQAAHRMGHHPGRPEGQHQAEEHANAFEGEGVGAGKERVGGGEGKQPDDHRDKPTGGANGLRMNAGNLNAAGGDLVENHFHQANDEPGDEGK